MSKHANLALRCDSTLLIMSLTSSSDPVGVPISPGYVMLLTEIVILVRLGSDYWGRNSQTTFLKDIYFLRSSIIFSHLMTKKVSELTNCCLLGPSLPLNTP